MQQSSFLFLFREKFSRLQQSRSIFVVPQKEQELTCQSQLSYNTVNSPSPQIFTVFCSYCRAFKPSAKYFHYLSTIHFLIGLLALVQLLMVCFFQKSTAALKDSQNNCDSMHLCQPVSGDWFKRYTLDSVPCGRMEPADQTKGAQKRNECCCSSHNKSVLTGKTHPDCCATWLIDLSRLPLSVSCPAIILPTLIRTSYFYPPWESKSGNLSPSMMEVVCYH